MHTKILLVQDNKELRVHTADALHTLDTDVIQCSTALEAVAALEVSSQIDLVVTDVQMPGPLNGYELAQIIRVFKPKMPIIVTSITTAPLLDKLPPHSVLLKEPWAVEVLLDMVSEQLKISA